MTHDQFVRLELKGDTDVAVAFIEGYRLATPESERVWYSHWEPIKTAGWFDKLRERIGSQVRVVMPETMADRVAEAVTETPRLKLEVGERSLIRDAVFDFSFRVFSPDEASGIRRLLEEDLPDGVSLDDYEHEEKRDPSAKGIELYSPVHEYEFSGSGRYVGTVPGVFEMVHRLADQTFLHHGDVTLRYVE
jgi:hypothetical protein